MLFFPENQALVVGWHVHLEKCFAGVTLNHREAPNPHIALPTILSRVKPLAWPNSSRRAVSRSPHSGFLHLRVRSKSTLLWGEIFPLMA